MKLYELVSDFNEFMARVEEGDVPEEAIVDTLESIELAIEAKADNLACFLKNLDAEITAIKTEENRLAERRRSKEKTYARVKEYLAENLQRAGIDKMETIRAKITFRKSEAVEVDKSFVEWAEKGRDDLLTYSAPKPNKSAIKELLESGEEIPGARIVISQNLQLK